jgi:hypothetical protein
MLRSSGKPPFWEPGSVILWRYRKPGWRIGQPERIRPMRVVRDDERALVAWLAPHTPIVQSVRPDGSDPRSAGLDQLFLGERRSVRSHWSGNGTLKVAPTGVPWSLWFFWHDDGSFANWYVNLEDPHVRDERNLITSDHVLDVVVKPDGEIHLKDEDELEAAVVAGRYTTAQATAIRNDAREVEALARQWASPFSDGWEHWRPEAEWPLPQLPDNLTTDF